MSLTLNMVGGGSAPAYDYKGWLQAGGISPTGYSSLEDVLADEPTVRILMTKHASADYLFEWYQSDFTVLDKVLDATYGAKWLGLRDYVCDKFMADPTAKATMLVCENWEYILKDKVPIMTDYSAPYGTAYANTNINACWGAFNDENVYWQSNTVSGCYIGYQFTNPICVKKFMLKNANATYGIRNFVLQGSNDGTNYTDITNGTLPSDLDYHYFDADNSDYYLYYRITPTTLASSSAVTLGRLQFYGRALTVSVPVMTSNTKPWGEAVLGGTFQLECYKALDNNESTFAVTDYPPNTTYFGYEFATPMNCKLAKTKICNNTSGSRTTTLRLDYKLDGSDTWTQTEQTITVTQTETNPTWFYFALAVDNVKAMRLVRTDNEAIRSRVHIFQAYGSDYSEHSERHYIYDNGVEVESVNARGVDTSGEIKEANQLKISSSTANAGFRTSSLNVSRYMVCRAKIGFNATGLTLCCIYAYDETNSAFNLFTAASAPNNLYLDISSFSSNTNLYYESYHAGTVLLAIKELWLE